jgi:hypothetical protein
LQVSPTDERAAKRAERGLARLASRGERLQSSL